ncbi:MAG: PQQ-binding-like beta-propeller repeat protein [Bacteroidales bacterium]
MKTGKLLTAVLVAMLSISNLMAQDWPQFLGPDRNSKSAEKGILRTWPANGPEVLWTANVGPGFGGPAIKAGKVYLLDRDDKVGETLRCFDLNTGKELWKYSYSAPGSVQFPGSRYVPTVDGNYVYSVGHNGDIYCIDINTHKPVWNKNIWTDYGGEKLPTWAITQCPLVYGDIVLVASQAPQAGVVAYNKLTGAVKWKTPSLGAVGYVSPAIVKISGEDHVVMVTASKRGGGMGKIVGIKPQDGKILWEYADWNCNIPVASAVDAGQNRILVAGGYELGTVMIKVDKKADGSFTVSELFKHNNFGEHTKPPILHNGYFYGQFSTNSKRDGLVCMDMNGEIKWKTMRSPNFDKGSMILVDGLIIATDGANSLYLIDPSPEGYKQLATAKMLNAAEGADARFATQNWAPIALSGGKLLIRDQGQMKCVKVTR